MCWLLVNILVGWLVGSFVRSLIINICPGEYVLQLTALVRVGERRQYRRPAIDRLAGGVGAFRTLSSYCLRSSFDYHMMVYRHHFGKSRIQKHPH